MRDSGQRDPDLLSILEEVRLGYLPDREGGWNARKEWKDVLSGGEKQRVSFARILYHEPRYAIIDEGTSAVSSDVEGLLYERCKERGVTLLTISTRVSLKRYHTWNLDLGQGDGGGKWTFDRIGTEEDKEGVEREVESLRARLAMVKGWEERRGVIERELGKVWVKGEGDESDELLPPGYATDDSAC